MAADTPPPYISLLDISREIQEVLASSMNRFYWVRAEIAKLNYYRPSGHCYPTLVEKKDGQVMAEVRSTIWANDYRMIQQKFRTVAGKELTEGITILCYARVSYHPVYGLSLQIADVDPSFTLGEMALERTRTIARLKEEGVWDRNRNLTMPLLPKRLAVISIETSKGYHDFRNILEHNSWGYSFFHMLFPALLQGDKAVESIGSQLDQIATVHTHFDAVLIIRGGGGEVGMSCFDHYNLARRVANFPIPVVSGIGHSTNETITEMVSHTNAITPTDVAYLLLQHFHNFAVKVDQWAETLLEVPTEMITQELRRLDEVTLRTTGSARLFTGRHHANLDRLATRTVMSPLQRLTRNGDMLVTLSDRLRQSATWMVRRSSERIEGLEGHARLLDPVNVLQRGYSIARINGQAVRSSKDTKIGDEVEITLYEGVIESVIKRKKD
ncbi:MAG: exodeoxyribonuclease VII large subunit [Bacteroidales bacterium]